MESSNIFIAQGIKVTLKESDASSVISIKKKFSISLSF